MLDMGFGPQISNIIDHSEMPPKGQRTTLMFSATFPDEIQKMAANFLHDYLFLTVGRVGVACSDVQQTIIQLQSSEKRNKLEEILQQSGKCFVFSCFMRVCFFILYANIQLPCVLFVVQVDVIPPKFNFSISKFF